MQSKGTTAATMSMASLPLVITVLVLVLLILASNMLQAAPQQNEQGMLQPETITLHESALLGPRPEDGVPTVDAQSGATESAVAGAMVSPVTP